MGEWYITKFFLVHVFMYNQSLKEKRTCPSIQKRPNSKKKIHKDESD